MSLLHAQFLDKRGLLHRASMQRLDSCNLVLGRCSHEHHRWKLAVQVGYEFLLEQLLLLLPWNQIWWRSWIDLLLFKSRSRSSEQWFLHVKLGVCCRQGLLAKQAAQKEILVTIYDHGRSRKRRIGMQWNHLLKLFAIEFFFSFSSNQELFILRNSGLESLLRANWFFEHAEEVNWVVLVQALHLFEQHSLFFYLGNVVNGLVKDRSVELFYSCSCITNLILWKALTLLFQNTGCLLHDRVSDFSQVLS